MGMLIKSPERENSPNTGNQFPSVNVEPICLLKPCRINHRGQNTVADVGYSGINVSGGDSLLVTAVSQSPTPITRNSCQTYHQLMADSNPEFHHQAVNTCSSNLSAEDSLMMDARPSSTAVEYQDLSQYNESTSRLHNHCEQTSNVKGFPHIMLSTRRPVHEEWSGEQQQHPMHSTVQYFGDREGSKAKVDCYNVSSQEPSDIETYNTSSLLHQYRKHQCAMQSEPQDSYLPSEYHQPILPSVTSYGVYPGLLQKQRHYPFKHDSGERLPSLWDRKGISNIPAESSGTLRPSERDLSYLKPPPVDLDDVSVKQVIYFVQLLYNTIYEMLRCFGYDVVLLGHITLFVPFPRIYGRFTQLPEFSVWEEFVTITRTYLLCYYV